MPAATPAPGATASTPSAQPAATATSATTSTSAATSVAATTPTATSRATVSNIPGYPSTTNYSAGKTVAYIIAPFAVVAGTYFLGHHHQLEINPGAGFFWPRHNDDMHLRDEGLYSLKALASLTDHVQIEGNFGYINHFESRFAPTQLDQSFGILPSTVHGLIYDVNGVLNLGERPFFGKGVIPYVVAGVGGLSTLVENGTAALIGGQVYATDPATGAAVLDAGPKVTVADNSAFFSVNYGGGVKTTKLWGPMGVRVDVRGRTFPNFRGNALTWPEATAGLLFTFGE